MVTTRARRPRSQSFGADAAGERDRGRSCAGAAAGATPAAMFNSGALFPSIHTRTLCIWLLGMLAIVAGSGNPVAKRGAAPRSSMRRAGPLRRFAPAFRERSARRSPPPAPPRRRLLRTSAKDSSLSLRT
ncbi:hypothetical protein EVAR_43946_1 [Eumeta japonica]|uniref:Uncharacterized protein n=1 Tax=Eumeta variegata TaxID=151549 RepID=A0A4C1Y2K4_EUMVA|nr:hypothetical protein EVAR_43946_1 [Eumeta japonica]